MKRLQNTLERAISHTSPYLISGHMNEYNNPSFATMSERAALLNSGLRSLEDVENDLRDLKVKIRGQKQLTKRVMERRSK
jgi:hypothetical protein